MRRWQAAVQDPDVYDLEVDTALTSPADCAAQIGRLLAKGLPSPIALQRLAAG